MINNSTKTKRFQATNSKIILLHTNMNFLVKKFLKDAKNNSYFSAHKA